MFVGCAYYDAVIPGKNCQLVEPSDEVPASSRVACNEDSKRDDGEGVHILFWQLRHAKPVCDRVHFELLES